MDYAKYAEEVHQTAVEHGWWENERDPREAYALMHSELSEALEEARQGRPMYYSNPEKPDKPEGIGIELIDFVIRAMDFMAHYKISFIPVSQRASVFVDQDPLPILIYKLHNVLDTATNPDRPAIDFENGKILDTWDLGCALTVVIEMVFEWLKANGASAESFLKEKANYNKTRPYKHGKQF